MLMTGHVICISAQGIAEDVTVAESGRQVKVKDRELKEY